LPILAGHRNVKASVLFEPMSNLLRRDLPHVEFVITLVVIAIFLVGLGYAHFAGSGPLNLDNDVYRVCKDWTTKQLKSPATAVYPPLSALEETEGYGFSNKGAAGYTLSGYVDAQNGFGALLRSDFVCKAKKEGDNWRGSSILIPR
jgi:hypothetical protein